MSLCLKRKKTCHRFFSASKYLARLTTLKMSLKHWQKITTAYDKNIHIPDYTINTSSSLTLLKESYNHIWQHTCIHNLECFNALHRMWIHNCTCSVFKYLSKILEKKKHINGIIISPLKHWSLWVDKTSCICFNKLPHYMYVLYNTEQPIVISH